MKSKLKLHFVYLPSIQKQLVTSHMCSISKYRRLTPVLKFHVCHANLTLMKCLIIANNGTVSFMCE